MIKPKNMFATFCVLSILKLPFNNQLISSTIQKSNLDDSFIDPSFNLVASSSSSLWNSSSASSHFGKQNKSQDQDEQSEYYNVVSFSSSFPPLQVEWLNDVDTSRPAPCGAFKCVFHSKSFSSAKENAQQVPGYLVAQKMFNKSRFQKKRNEYDVMNWSYDKAKDLATKFSINHFLVDEPHTFHCNTTCATNLNRNRYATSGFRKTYRASILGDEDGVVNDDHDDDSDDGDRSQLLIQPISVAPSYYLFFGCTGRKLRTSQQQLQFWMNHKETSRRGYNEERITTTLIKTSSRKTSLEDKTTMTVPQISYEQYEFQLSRDFRVTYEMLSSRAGKCLVNDFQIMIDPITGRMYQLDIDRCFERKDQTQLVTCMNELQNYTQTLLEWKKRANP